MSTLTLIARFLARPGHEDRLRKALIEMIEPSLSESGCLAYHPYVDAKDPARMILVESWTSKDALDLHFATPHFKRIAKELEILLAEPFELTRFTPTTSESNA